MRQIEDFVKFCEETYSTVRLLYVEMTPRHTDRCCSDREHMGEDDVWVLDNQRREVNMEETEGEVGVCVLVRVQWTGEGA